MFAHSVHIMALVTALKGLFADPSVGYYHACSTESEKPLD